MAAIVVKLNYVTAMHLTSQIKIRLPAHHFTIQTLNRQTAKCHNENVTTTAIFLMKARNARNTRCQQNAGRPDGELRAMYLCKCATIVYRARHVAPGRMDRIGLTYGSELNIKYESKKTFTPAQGTVALHTSLTDGSRGRTVIYSDDLGVGLGPVLGICVGHRVLNI
ncbi:hypothetical protein EVAR_37275_1 [Eumeta japonica]|uniref:Uncharacterized protein n=1 Tax=Eumeta variegata TaxID=151549 RepID=A0A4C1WM98_EUMVA|nr:hypothetical protein EVAR_37275_1 [Eumeta japonica]